MLQEHLDGIGEKGERSFRERRLRLLAVQERLAHKFIPFSPLGFACFAWSLPGQLAPTFAALPPFDKIVTRALVPEVAVAGLLEGDEAPDATRLPDFLDDADTLDRRHVA